MSDKCSKERVGIGLLVVVILACIITPIVVLVHKSDKRQDNQVSPTQAYVPAIPAEIHQRINCFPEELGGFVNLSKKTCEERKCVYLETDDGSSCVFPDIKEYGFSVVEETTVPYKTMFTLRNRGRSPFSDISPMFVQPTLEIEDMGADVLRIKFDDGKSSRYKVPLTMDLPTQRRAPSQYQYEVTDRDNFAFIVKRKSTGTILFDTRVGGLTLTDKFLQLATRLPSTNIYGFGENIHQSFKHNMINQTWPMFSRDQGTGGVHQFNLYGVHPFYTCMENDGNSHGVLLLNSNAQEYSFTPLPMLTYRTIGGILDFYIFLGPSPENVIQQYTKAIGRPFMPPYWALGFQLSRYGYNNLTNLQNAVKRTRDANIPQDVQYADIDHMEDQKDFTIDNNRFKGLKKYFDELREDGMRTIIILDPCFITNETNYEPYDKLRSVKGGIMWPDNVNGDGYTDPTGAILGYVWPNGKVVFPDFFKTQTKRIWKELIVKHRNEKLAFDAMWIDMNEPANFGTNLDKPWNWPSESRPYWSLKCPKSEWDDPPYRTMASFVHDKENKRETRLSDKTICMSARQGDSNNLLHYNVHSLYGWSQSQPTLEAMREVTKERSMVLSRSTYPGSGKYAGHWLGDNDSTWSSMRMSIIGMLEFNLFGIPYIGADICGFFKDTTDELCTRWMQLGAFYPFSRNHNGKGQINQDPAGLGASVAKASRVVLETRYWLLPYLYTLFHYAHVNGNTVVRPLHHEFPQDKNTLDIKEQFLWGRSLLISPILYELKEKSKIDLYLPAGRWYDFYNGSMTMNTGMKVSKDVGDDTQIPLHLRGGSILPLQQPSKNTKKSRMNPMKILVALDKDDADGGRADGTLFWDDGVSVDTFEHGNFLLGKFIAEKTVLSYMIEAGDIRVADELFVNTVEIWGVKTNVSHVLVEGNHHKYTFEQKNHILTVTNLSVSLSEAFRVTWLSYSEDDLSRIDCYPERLGGVDNVTKNKCEQRQCIYAPTSSAAPECYFPKENYGFKMINNSMQHTEFGWNVSLKSKGKSPFQTNIENLTFEVEMYGDSLLRFTIDDQDKTRYKVPIALDLMKETSSEPRYEIKITSEDPFSFQIIRRSSKAVIWDTGVGGFTYENQFIQIATRLPSRNVYGFGENVHSKFKHDLWWKHWPMFSRDEPTGDQNYKNHYGVHPFYTCVEDDGQSHGVLLLNSNAQDYAFTPLPMLIYRTIGGILDFYFFMGPEPEIVIQQYTAAIGKPYMPPYWSLGFHLCRYGYDKIEELQAAVNRTRLARIPHDVQYADIDHMQDQMDFTIDPVRFHGLNKYFKQLQSQGMKTIIILDPCLISDKPGYKPYDKITSVNGSITWPLNYDIPQNSSDANGAILGYVWPEGKVIFPDFFKNRTNAVWTQLIKDHHMNLSFDGLWIDMNEPANFGTNLEKPWNWPTGKEPWSLHCRENDTLEDPPYRTMAAIIHDDPTHKRKIRLSDKTICMVAKQGNSQEYNHYDVHSLYGWSQTKSTLDGVRDATNKRGIVISRSTYPGSGKYAGHWLGDNSAVWPDLHLSVIGSLEFNLFGIPYIGADICGFFGNSTSELCKRWMQLGAFYTFSRNHNGKGYLPQDPGWFDNDVKEASRIAMETRYSLLPYLYTLFYIAHTKGGTVMRPLHHEFPKDSMTYDIDTQFLWGPALLISPILFEKQSSVAIYLPSGRWYDFYDGNKYTGNRKYVVDVDENSKIPLHVRGGFIIPMQDPALNTYRSRQNNITLCVALDFDGRRYTANGELFWDDGESTGTIQNNYYFYSKFEFGNNILKMSIQNRNESLVSNLYIHKIVLLGLSNNMKYAYHTEQKKAYTIDHGLKKSIQNIQVPLSKEFSIVFQEELNPNSDEALRIDCGPDIEGTGLEEKTKCLTRGCLWETISNKIAVPKCYIDNKKYGYTMINDTKNPENTTVTVNLQWKNESSMFGGDILSIRLTIYEITENILRLKFDDPRSARYEVPVPLNTDKLSKTGNIKYNVSYGNDTKSMFFVRINRKETGKTIWDTSIGGFTFSDQFLQLATSLPSSYVYGFGENRHFSLKHNLNYKRWPMFSRDNGVNWGDYANLYGVHPFYMCIEDDSGNSHGVLLLNSNAMEILFQPHPALTYRTIGGILDFYLILGSSPESVIQQYTGLIGRPYMPPYWALGFQLSRYGYNNIENLKSATLRTLEANIPLDVQYADIDHMDERKDFTIDQINFKGLSDYVSKLHSENMHFIIILDPALISNETSYEPYELGKASDVFIKWPNSSMNPDFLEYNRTDILGYVWPKGKVVFPDFLKNETREYWIGLIKKHHKTLPFDGLWIDMNEPANFGTNEKKPFNWPEKDDPWSLKCPVTYSHLDNPPYKPRGVYGAFLSDKTLCMEAVQNDGKYTHYNVHSLYGWSETEPTLAGLRSAVKNTTGKDLRGIVISRSTYPSSGKFTGHWLGDNDSKWPDVHDSIIGIIEFNLFGIPYIGADICGFFGDSTAELCERWMQMGAFYTFARNHNTINTKDQDPAVFGPAVAESSRKAMELRYSLLPYLYTLFYNAHKHGSTVIRSLMQNFPRDLQARAIDTQFMWGSAIMIAPVLAKGKIEVEVYFPSARWYEYRTGKQIRNGLGRTLTISAPRDFIPLFICGGTIVPTQKSGNNTVSSRNNPMTIIVAPNENNTASGELFVDDGESIDTIENNLFYLSTFSFNGTYFTMEIQDNNSTAFSDTSINTIIIYGVDGDINTVYFNSVSILSFKRNPLYNVLSININATLNASFTISIS